MNTLRNRSLPLLICYVMICLGITSCKCTLEQSENTYTAEAGRENLHKIDAAEYGTAIFPETDTLELTFPCIPGKAELTTGLVSRSKGTTVWIWFEKSLSSSLRSATSTRLQAHFPAQNYTLQVRRAAPTNQVQVMAGDANNDGRIDMMDLFPIAYGIKKFSGVPIAPPLTNSDPTTMQGGTTFSRIPTGDTWAWNNANSTVDFIHADCNGDGIINRADADLLEANLNPLLLPTMLRGNYTNIGLTAALSSGHPIEVYTRQVNNQTRSEVRAWYDIRIASPSGQHKILGVVFTRPVAEDPGTYEVLNIQINTNYSDLVGNPSALLGLQQYWDLPIEFPDSCSEVKGISKPLDVGVFNTADIQSVGATDCIISCGVTIDDMLRTAGTGQVTAIYQHLINVVIFSESADGVILAQTTDCNFDAVDLSQHEKIVEYKSNNLPGDWMGATPTPRGSNH